MKKEKKVMSRNELKEIGANERKKIKEISQSLKIIPTKILAIITAIFLIIFLFQKEIGLSSYENIINAIFTIVGTSLLRRLGEYKGYMEGYEHGHDDGIDKILGDELEY